MIKIEIKYFQTYNKKEVLKKYVNQNLTENKTNFFLNKYTKHKQKQNNQTKNSIKRFLAFKINDENKMLLLNKLRQKISKVFTLFRLKFLQRYF